MNAPKGGTLRFVSRNRVSKWEEVGKIKQYTEEEMIEKAQGFLREGVTAPFGKLPKSTLLRQIP